MKEILACGLLLVTILGCKARNDSTVKARPIGPPAPSDPPPINPPPESNSWCLKLDLTDQHEQKYPNDASRYLLGRRLFLDDPIVDLVFRLELSISNNSLTHLFKNWRPTKTVNATLKLEYIGSQRLPIIIRAEVWRLSENGERLLEPYIANYKINDEGLWEGAMKTGTFSGTHFSLGGVQTEDSEVYYWILFEDKKLSALIEYFPMYPGGHLSYHPVDC